MLVLMRRKIGIGVAWLAATALSVLIASAAVAGIRDRVVETPVAIGPPTTTLAPDTTSAPTGPTTTTPVTEAPTTTSTTTTAPPVTTTVVESVTTTTAPPAATTTTTAPPQTTTTVAALEYQTFDLVGGSVTLSFGNGEVNLVSATPRPGFSAEYEHTGPVEVEIKFEGEGHKSKLEAKIENGQLKVSTDEESDGVGDGHDDD